MLETTPRSLRHAPAIAALVFAIVMLAWSWWHWWTFQYSTFDLAFYVQALWGALRGHSMVTLLDVPLLGNHAEPVVFLALPFFAIWPHPMLLVGIQVAAVATMPLSAWRICQRLGISAENGVLLSVATVITPGIAWAALHEFHPETLAAPLIPAIVLARLNGRRVAFWLLWLLLLGCKENIALMLCWWGLLFAWLERDRGWRHALQWNLIPAGVAGVWLAAFALWLSPWLNGGKVAYGELYSHLGTSSSEILRGFFSHPERAIRAFVRGATHGDLLGGVLLPWLGLALLRPRWLLIAAPLILQHLLSWRSSEWSIRLHYGAPLVGLTWVAVAEAIAPFSHQRWWCWGILVGSFAGQMAVGPIHELVQDIADIPRRLVERSEKEFPLKEIQSQPQLSVIASNGYLPHLAARAELHSLHHLLKGLKTLSRTDYHPPKAAATVLVDFGDATTFSSPSGFYHPQMRTTDGRTIPSSDALLDNYLREAHWERRAVNGVSLFRRVGEVTSDAAGDEALPLQLREAHWEPRSSGGGQHLTASYLVPMKRADFPWASVIASRGTDRFLVPLGMLGAGAQPGDHKERWEIRWPQTAPAGTYRTTLLIYNQSRASWENRSPLSLPDTVQRDLGEVQLP